MNKYFTVLQDNTLKRVLVEEQETNEVLAIKSLEKLQSESSYPYVNRVVYKLITHSYDKFTEGYAFNWEVVESQYADKSSLRTRYSTFETKGSAIREMLKDGFHVFIDGVEFKL